jgi:hypothetical protein
LRKIFADAESFGLVDGDTVTLILSNKIGEELITTYENKLISFKKNIVIENNKLDTVRERLNQSKFQRIYLSSIREQDIFVLKTTNGKDMLNEDHCINVSK